MKIRRMIGQISRKLGFTKHPMQKVVERIEKKGYILSSMNAIELFAKDGAWSTDYIGKRVNSIDLVEIDNSLKSILELKYPKSNIYIDNTYELIKVHPIKYDIVIADAPFAKHGAYFQHFSLFPNVFRIFNEKCILIINVIPNYKLIDYSNYFNEELEAYKKFYSINNSKITIDKALETYKLLGESNGFNLVDSFDVSRGKANYLILFYERLK